MARINIDNSDCSTILVCESCRVWYAFANSIEDAHESAVTHEQRSHPGENDAANARSYWRGTRRK